MRWKITRMAQENQTPKCSNSSGCWAGGDGDGNDNINGNGNWGNGNISRSFKKQKQKKVPQRGLGVAQLEKIRLEEQQMKDAAASATVLSSPLSLNESSYLSFPIPQYHHSNQSFSSIPFSSPPSVDLSPVNSIFRPPFLTQNINVRKLNTVSLPNNDGFEIPGHAHVPKLWNPYDYNLEKEYHCGLDPGLAFRCSRLNIPNESNPIWPLNIQRTQQYQQLCPSMVNFPSSTSSSGYQMEPPSNQNYYGVPLWPEEEERLCPFTIPAFASVPLRADALRSHRSIKGTSDLEPSNQMLRKAPSCSLSVVSESNSKSNKEKDHPNGDFLTLSPPTSRTCPLSSELSNPSTYPTLHNLEWPEFNTLPCQGSEKSFKPASSRSREQHAFYNFFAQGKEQNGKIGTSLQHDWNEDEEESIDLNLKL